MKVHMPTQVNDISVSFIEFPDHGCFLNDFNRASQ